MGRSFISRNLRHVNIDIEPIRVPVVSQVGLAAGRDLNSRDPPSSVLSPGVESPTRLVSFVKLPVFDFDNVGHNDQLKKPCESVDAEVAPESLHNPNLSVRKVVPTLTSDERRGLSLNGRC
jgi:hypothetical protein